MTEQTITRERTEVQTVEEMLYVCPCCEQAYEDDEVVRVAINVTSDGNWYDETTQVCQRCTEGLLGYEVPEGYMVGHRPLGKRRGGLGAKVKRLAGHMTPASWFWMSATAVAALLLLSSPEGPETAAEWSVVVVTALLLPAIEVLEGEMG